MLILFARIKIAREEKEWREMRISLKYVSNKEAGKKVPREKRVMIE